VSDIEMTEMPEAPLESGQAEGEVVGASEEVSEPSYFNYEDYADHRVKLPVAGEEIEVPLSEALAGYQRQADYTRKTQELAEQRKEVQFAAAIQQALQNDPAATIQLLTEHYGINAQQSSEDDLYMDPAERQLRELDNRVRSFEEAQAMQELERNIATLQSKYGEDFDANEVVAAALASGNDNLEAVYKQVAFDRLLARQNVQNEYAAKQAAAQDAALQAKRDASVISGGSSAHGTSVGIAPISSIKDAFAAAKQQMGIS
jgi:hypothetical protein